MHRLIQIELERIQKSFPGQGYITLDEYAEFFSISRRNASRHPRSLDIPIYKMGKAKNSPLLIAVEDIAEYFARCKQGKNQPLIKSSSDIKQVMKDRRGFNQAAVSNKVGNKAI